MDYDIPEDYLDCWYKGCHGQFSRATKRCSEKPHIHTYDGLGLVSDRVRYMVATDLTWQVDIVNKSSYWYRHFALKAGGSVMEDPTDGDRKNFYAEDPNYSSISGSTDFVYINSTDSLDPDISTAQKLLAPTYMYSNYWSWSTAEASPKYIPENTMVQSEQKGNMVTRVIFKAILKREKFKDIDNYATVKETIETENPDLETLGEFFVLKGNKDDTDIYKYNNYNKDGSTFFILRPEDVAVYARAYIDNGESWAGININIHPYFKEEIEEALPDFISKNQSFNWTDLSANTEPAVSDKLLFYKNGEMYYAVPIEHFTVTETGEGGHGRFGVVRNNWYNLNVQNIISIGYPTIPERTTELLEEPTGTGGSGAGTRSSNGSQRGSQSIIF